ncbi:MAG TPA: AbrB/MazE/SpoVT family DNA-binding domain-containing protein [Dehalococcoidia bacterium]|nr:AbrB/MazE/SpoVT family DNA-binding domain-containing protein [Dehalococcoidia bacterium]
MEQHPKPGSGKQRPKLTAVVGQKYRIVVPQHIREELGIKEGDTLLSFVEDGRWIIMTKAQARKRMEKAIQEHPEAANMVELLYQDRREDFKKEEREEAEALERYRESHGG